MNAIKFESFNIIEILIVLIISSLLANNSAQDYDDNYKDIETFMDSSNDSNVDNNGSDIGNQTSNQILNQTPGITTTLLTSTNKPKSSLALLIGISVVLILLALIAIICCICCIKKRSKSETQQTDENNDTKRKVKSSEAKQLSSDTDNKSVNTRKSAEFDITQSESSFTDSIENLNEKKVANKTKERLTEQDEDTSLKSHKSYVSTKSLPSNEELSVESVRSVDSDFTTKPKSKN